MERIGLCRHISLQSSWSGGLHLYFSLPKKVNTYDAACLIKWACLKAGLIITPGHLELFPNTKNYVLYDPENPNQQFSLYNGLRLPCQPTTGSFLLDPDFNPISDRTFQQDYPEVFDKVTQTKEPNQNQIKAQQATERIKQTVAKLEAENRFPQGAVERTIAKTG